MAEEGGEMKIPYHNSGFLLIQNITPTVITDIENGREKDILTIAFLDSNTKIDSSYFCLKDGKDFISSPNSTLTLGKKDGGWHEICRSEGE